MPPSGPATGARPLHRRPRAIALGAVAALAVAGLAVLGSLGGSSDPRASSGFALASAKLRAGGRLATFTLGGDRAWSPRALARSAALVCVATSQGRVAGSPRQATCVSASPGGTKLRLRQTGFAPNGHVTWSQPVSGRVARPDGRSLRITLGRRDVPGDLRVRWAAFTRWSGVDGCRRPAGSVDVCGSRLPRRAAFASAVAPRSTPPCVARAIPAGVKSGPRDRPVFGLAFDDGPGPQTAQVLDLLERHHVKATFYVIGQQIKGNEALLRRMVRGGHEIGNHSWRHRAGTGVDETTLAIKTATGWRPCTYRPPGGQMARLPSVRRDGLVTVKWDVDPTDWRLPGAAAIARNVVSQARPGSIVDLHDGGGERSQTVAALPKIVKGLRARGLEPTTVQDVLELEPRH